MAEPHPLRVCHQPPQLPSPDVDPRYLLNKSALASDGSCNSVFACHVTRIPSFHAAHNNSSLLHEQPRLSNWPPYWQLLTKQHPLGPVMTTHHYHSLANIPNHHSTICNRSKTRQAATVATAGALQVDANLATPVLQQLLLLLLPLLGLWLLLLSTLSAHGCFSDQQSCSSIVLMLLHLDGAQYLIQYVRRLNQL